MTKYHIDGDIDFVETRKAHNKKSSANQKVSIKINKDIGADCLKQLLNTL